MSEALNLGRLALPPPDLTALLCPITAEPVPSRVCDADGKLCGGLCNLGCTHLFVCVLSEGRQGEGPDGNSEGGTFSPGRCTGTSSSESVPVEH